MGKTAMQGRQSKGHGSNTGQAEQGAGQQYMAGIARGMTARQGRESTGQDSKKWQAEHNGCACGQMSISA